MEVFIAQYVAENKFLGFLLMAFMSVIVFVLKNIKKDFFNKESDSEKGFLEYVKNRKHIYELDDFLQELEEGKFLKRFNGLIDYHRKRNIDVLIDMSNAQTVDGAVSRDIEKGVIDLISDNRVRLTIIFPVKKVMCKNTLQLFDTLSDLTKRKETINITEDKYIDVHTNRRV